jgi:hypothetical protein
MNYISVLFFLSEPPEWEDFDGDEDVFDMRAFCVQGGIFHFNLLHMPPQPKLVNTWIMRQGQYRLGSFTLQKGKCTPT